MKSLKQILLAVFIGMAVVPTAHAENYQKLWIDSTSGKDSAAEAVLLSSLVSSKSVVDMKVKTDAIANLAYEKAASDKWKCFSSISESISEPDFRAEWKMGFRVKYRMTADTISWDVFKDIGRRFGGFEICNQDENKIFIQQIKDKQQVAVLKQQQESLAAGPRTPAEQAKSDALAAIEKDLESKIAGNTVAIGTHDKLILGLRTDVDNATALANKANEVVTVIAGKVEALEDRFGPIETTAGDNAQAIEEIHSTLTTVETDSAAAKAAAEEARTKAEKVDAAMYPPGQPSFPDQITEIWERVKNNEVAVSVIGIVGLLLILAFATPIISNVVSNVKKWWVNRPKKENRPPQMTGPADLPRTAGKPAQTSDVVRDLNTPADKPS